MVEYQDPVSNVFAAIAHPVRRALIERLEQGEATIGELGEPFAMSFEGVSKHVRALERAGLVAREVQGRRHVVRLRPEPMREAASWIEHYRIFWEGRLDALERHLARKHGTPSQQSSNKE